MINPNVYIPAKLPALKVPLGGTGRRFLIPGAILIGRKHNALNSLK